MVVMAQQKIPTRYAMYSPQQWKAIDFAGPFNFEKELEHYILTSIDRFSKYPSQQYFDNASVSNVLKFLDNQIPIQGLPRFSRLDQARCLIGNQVKTFFTKKM